MHKIKNIFKRKCCFILAVTLIVNLFACKNASNLLDANDSNVKSFETETLQAVTIGIEAYNEANKDYPSELSGVKQKNTSTVINDTLDNTDENIALEEIADDQDVFEVLDIEPNVDSNDASTTSETQQVRHKKRFIDYEYDTLDPVIVKKVYLNKDYQYATFSVINSGYATLYMINKKVVPNYKGKVVAVNAGHGVKGGSRKKTFISDGMVFLNGIQESVVNLLVALKLRDKLINEGYTVLMMREDENSHLDNISRTVIANEYADCHLSIHFDSTAKDKGIFYVKPVSNKSFLEMEPLKSNYDNIVKLGDCLIAAFRERNEKIWRNEGILPGDLTQIAFSTNASVDIELGDRASVVDEARADALADGLLLGIQKFFDLN